MAREECVIGGPGESISKKSGGQYIHKQEAHVGNIGLIPICQLPEVMPNAIPLSFDKVLSDYSSRVAEPEMGCHADSISANQAGDYLPSFASPARFAAVPLGEWGQLQRLDFTDTGL